MRHSTTLRGLILASLGLGLLAICPAGAQELGAQPVAKSRAPIHHTRHLHRQAAPRLQDASLHVPPGPPAFPTEGAAPVPDENIGPPTDRQQPEANLSPSIFQLHYPSSGDGYVAGSSPQTMDNEHAAQIGGVQLEVPLH